MVRRDHIAAINPGRQGAEWNPLGGSNSFEGDKAMEATPRGLLVGGDGMFKGGAHRTRRILRLQHGRVPGTRARHLDHDPDRGTVVAANVPFDITGRRGSPPEPSAGVQVQIQDRDSGQFLQDDGTAFTTFGNSGNTTATLSGSGTTRTVGPGHHHDEPQPAGLGPGVHRRQWRHGDTTRATKKFESFSTDDQTPTTSITGPSGIQSSTTTMTGTARTTKASTR